MTRHRLTDEEIGEALLRHGENWEPAQGGTGAAERDACVHEDRLWDLARGALDPDLTGRILDHVLECPDCSLALRVAHETFAVSQVTPEASRSTNFVDTMWGGLAGSVLRPAPAFAYLVLLLLSFPLYRVLTATTPATPRAPLPAIPGGPSEPAAPSDSAAPFRAPGLRSLRVLRLEGDLSLRGGGAQSAPLRIHLGEAEALVLKLFPDVEDLPKDPRAALLVRVLDGETIVAATTRRVTDLERDQSVSLLLDRALLRSGTIYRVELTAAPSASPILRQSFRLESGG
jgi:hypothetical protein